MEYLWCGLPVIYNNYADLAHAIREFDAGWAVDPGDEAAIRAAIRAVLDDPKLVAGKAANAHRLVRARLTWDIAVGPLAAFCAEPTFRPRTTSLAGASAAVEIAALRRAVYDKDIHIRNLEAMLARQTPLSRALYYWGRVRHYYERGGLRAVVSQTREKIRYLRTRRRS